MARDKSQSQAQALKPVSYGTNLPNNFGASQSESILNPLKLIQKRSFLSKSKLVQKEKKTTEPIRYLLLVPQDLHTADPSLSIELDMKQFGLAGVTANIANHSVFDVTPPRVRWAEELHQFAWLRHLRAARTQRAASQAIDIVSEWIYRHRKPMSDRLEFAPNVLARRVINWLSHSNFILTDAHKSFYALVMQNLDMQVGELERTVVRTPSGIARLNALIALVLTGLCAADQESLVNKYGPMLASELNYQILPDGGHISRNNSLLVDLLLDLLPLKQCFVARDIKPPKAILQSIRRILPMIHYMRLGDGLMARFNGVSATMTDTLSTAMAYDQMTDIDLELATYSHYYRLAHKDIIAILDGGRAPEKLLAQKHHAGALSFELSIGECPVIVNCGAVPPLFEKMEQIARATASHSTLTINNRSSARLLLDEEDSQNVQAAISGPPNVSVNVSAYQGLPRFEAAHDGYVKSHNLIHSRQLWTQRDGNKFFGRDEIDYSNQKRLKKPIRASHSDGPHSIPFVIRFHLHPDVTAVRSKDGRSVTLKLLNGQDWRFHASGKSVNLEASRFFADFAGPCQALQIVIRGTTNGDTRIDWSLENITQTVVLPQLEPDMITSTEDLIEKPEDAPIATAKIDKKDKKSVIPSGEPSAGMIMPQPLDTIKPAKLEADQASTLAKRSSFMVEAIEKALREKLAEMETQTDGSETTNDKESQAKPNEDG